MNPIVSRLPILVLSPHSRCNCRCLMCDIWKSAESIEIGAEELERHVAGIEGMGVEWVVLTGGDPLMHSDLFRLCAVLKRRAIRVTMLTTGLLLDRHASAIAANIDDVIVSLDGPAEMHNRIRRVAGAFEKLAMGVRSLRAVRPDFPITARCTVQRLNHSALCATVAEAHNLRLNGISFLAADMTSTAFNRPLGWSAERQAQVGLDHEQIARLEAEIESIVMAGECGQFVAESPEKLRRIVRHFRAHLGESEPVAPLCNAPWVSAVVEADGTVRPCFFQRSIGRIDARTSLADVINGAEAVAFREELDVALNPICRRCVCSLNWRGN